MPYPRSAASSSARLGSAFWAKKMRKTAGIVHIEIHRAALHRIHHQTSGRPVRTFAHGAGFAFRVNDLGEHFGQQIALVKAFDATMIWRGWALVGKDKTDRNRSPAALQQRESDQMRRESCPVTRESVRRSFIHSALQSCGTGRWACRNAR